MIKTLAQCSLQVLNLLVDMIHMLLQLGINLALILLLQLG